jgi:hypothetical protein
VTTYRAVVVSDCLLICLLNYLENPLGAGNYGPIMLEQNSVCVLSFVKPGYPPPDLTYADREVLRSANGCFHCRLLPSVPHISKPHCDIAREYPGDERRGIPPRVACPVAAVTLHEESSGLLASYRTTPY